MFEKIWDFVTESFGVVSGVILQYDFYTRSLDFKYYFKFPSNIRELDEFYTKCRILLLFRIQSI